jgi:hypothetical protein
MDTKKLKLLSLILMLCDIAAAETQPSVTISNTENRFEIHRSGRVTQKIYSLQWPNGSAAYDANLASMELLRNTRIFAPNQRSCIIREEEDEGNNKTRTFERLVNASTAGITFKEIAKVAITTLKFLEIQQCIYNLGRYIIHYFQL